MTAANIIKLLFCFKKPQVINLSCIHVLVKNKPTLFIAWEIKNAFSVKLFPVKRSFYDMNSAALIAVPEDIDTVKVKISNIWRTKKILLTLQTVQLDEATTQQLIRGFRPLNKTEVSTPLIRNIASKAEIKPMTITQQNTAIKEVDRFNIHIQPFNYP